MAAPSADRNGGVNQALSVLTHLLYDADTASTGHGLGQGCHPLTLCRLGPRPAQHQDHQAATDVVILWPKSQGSRVRQTTLGWLTQAPPPTQDMAGGERAAAAAVSFDTGRAQDPHGIKITRRQLHLPRPQPKVSGGTGSIKPRVILCTTPPCSHKEEEASHEPFFAPPRPARTRTATATGRRGPNCFG